MAHRSEHRPFQILGPTVLFLFNVTLYLTGASTIEQRQWVHPLREIKGLLSEPPKYGWNWVYPNSCLSGSGLGTLCLLEFSGGVRRLGGTGASQAGLLQRGEPRHGLLRDLRGRRR